MGGAVSLNDDPEPDMVFAKTITLKVQLPEPYPKQIDMKLEDDLDFTVEYLK